MRSGKRIATLATAVALVAAAGCSDGGDDEGGNSMGYPVEQTLQRAA